MSRCLLFSACVVAAGVAACSPAESVTEHRGRLNEPCREDQGCDPGLICSNDRCIPAYDYEARPEGAGDSVSGDGSLPGDSGDFANAGDGSWPRCLDSAAERDVDAPREGELIVSEAFADPEGTDDGREWLELYVAAARPVDLNQLRIDITKLSTGTQRSFLVESSGCVTAEPGSYVVLGASTDTQVNGGVSVDVRIEGFSLFNDASMSVALSGPAGHVDSASVPASTSGVSSSLNPDELSAAGNDSLSAFCESRTDSVFDATGTPGAANDACGAACLESGSWRSIRHPGEGELVITEVYPDPAGADHDRDWLEVYVASANAIDINGLTIRNESAAGSVRVWTLSSDVCLFADPGSYVLIGGSAASNDGVAIDHVIQGESTTLLFNDGGQLRLAVDDAMVDVVSYAGTSGAAYALDGEVLSAAGNDAADVWCAAETSCCGFVGLGSPGVANPSCPRP